MGGGYVRSVVVHTLVHEIVSDPTPFVAMY